MDCGEVQSTVPWALETLDAQCKQVSVGTFPPCIGTLLRFRQGGNRGLGGSTPGSLLPYLTYTTLPTLGYIVREDLALHCQYSAVQQSRPQDGRVL